MKCAGCPRANDPLHCSSKGPTTAELVVVGNAPDKADLITGKPWSDGSGRILYAVMREAGLNPDDTRYINLANCLPSGGSKRTVRIGTHELTRGQNLTAGQFTACSERLVAELSSCTGAKVVVTLGSDAFKRVTGMVGGKLKQWQCHPIQASDCTGFQQSKKTQLPSPLPPSVKWVIPLYDPIMVMFSKTSADIGQLKAGFQHARDLLTGSPTFISVDGTGGNLRSLQKVLPAGPIAFDIETTGFDGPIGLISVACQDSSTGEVYSGSFPWTPPVMREIQRLLGTPGLPKVAHNAAFDVPRIEKYGLSIAGPLWDTMWAHQLLQPEMEKSLAAVSGYVLKVQPWKHANKESPGWYNRMDSLVTFKLYEPLRKMLSDDGMLELFEGTTMPVLRTLIDMTSRGIKVDNGKVAEWRDRLVAASDAELASLQALIGSDLNLNSHVQVKKLLYENLGFPSQYNGDKLTVDKGALKKLAKIMNGTNCSGCKGRGVVEIMSIHQQQPASACTRCDGRGKVVLKDGAEEIIKHLAEYNRVAKLVSTYSSITDEVHPSYFPVGKNDDDDDRYGTATGRLSSNNPNIQNQPPEAREIYVPRDGYAFVSHDYSQIELRLVAYLSNCSGLIDAFRSGADIHDVNMGKMGCDRTRAKNVVYGTMYGAGPKTIRETLLKEGFDVSLAECMELQQAFFRAYPEIQSWRDYVVGEVVARGYAVTVFGRRRYFYKPASQKPAIYNFHPQSVSADIIFNRIEPVNREYKKLGGHLICQVHDELVGEVPIRNIEEMCENGKRIMEAPFPQVHRDFTCLTNYAVGRTNWAEAH